MEKLRILLVRLRITRLRLILKLPANIDPQLLKQTRDQTEIFLHLPPLHHRIDTLPLLLPSLRPTLVKQTRWPPPRTAALYRAELMQSLSRHHPLQSKPRRYRRNRLPKEPQLPPILNLMQTLSHIPHPACQYVEGDCIPFAQPQSSSAHPRLKNHQSASPRNPPSPPASRQSYSPNAD